MNQPTPIADMVAEMLKNCIPNETIILAVRSMERAVSTRQTVDVTAEKRRQWDREYRRRKRGPPPDQPEIHPTTPEVGSDASFFREADRRFAEVIVKKEKKARGSKLPPDWVPKEKHYAKGAERGLSRKTIDDLAENMRAWCAANDNRAITTKADWDQAFMGAWVMRNGNGNAINGHRADTAAGRATASEVDSVTAMGGAAMHYLRQGASAGNGRPSSSGPDVAGGSDAERRRAGGH